MGDPLLTMAVRVSHLFSANHNAALVLDIHEVVDLIELCHRLQAENERLQAELDRLIAEATNNASRSEGS